LLAIIAEESRLQYAVNTAGARSNLKKIERAARRNLQRAGFEAPIPGIVNEVLARISHRDYFRYPALRPSGSPGEKCGLVMRIKLSG